MLTSNAMLTDEAIDRIVQAVERGSSLRQAALANGFTDGQLESWLRISRGEPYRGGVLPSQAQKAAISDLAERCQRAVSKRYTVLVNGLYANATTPNPKTGWIDTQAADKLLSKAPDTRDEWYERRHLEQHTTVELHPAHRVVRELSDAELLALPDGSDVDGEAAPGLDR